MCVRERERERERENVTFAMVFVSEILAILSISSLFIVPIDQTFVGVIQKLTTLIHLGRIDS